MFASKSVSFYILDIVTVFVKTLAIYEIKLLLYCLLLSSLLSILGKTQSLSSSQNVV